MLSEREAASERVDQFIYCNATLGLELLEDFICVDGTGVRYDDAVEFEMVNPVNVDKSTGWLYGDGIDWLKLPADMTRRLES